MIPATECADWLRSKCPSSNPLSASEIALSGLDRDVTKKELNLLQFAAGGAAAERNSYGDRAVRVW